MDTRLPADPADPLFAKVATDVKKGLDNLSTPDLADLTAEINALFDVADKSGNLDAMRVLYGLLEAVKAEQSSRGVDPDATDPEDLTPKTTSDTPEEGNPEMADLTNADVPEENLPVAAAAVIEPAIRVGGDIPGFTAGAALNSMDDVVEAMTRKVNSLRGVTGDGEHSLVASIRHETEIPEHRILRVGDSEGNARKVRAVASDPEALTPEALTAAGWCAPKEILYNVNTAWYGTTDRPIRDSLPSFNAERGGITVTPAPSLPMFIGKVSPFDHILEQFGIWSAAGVSTYLQTGAATSPANTKPCIDIPCGTQRSFELEALTVCLCFENLMTRAFPEWIRANTELSLVAQARLAEMYLMGKILKESASPGAAAVPATGADGQYVGTPDTPLGAARDFLVTVRLAAAQMRWRNRLSPQHPLQIVVPSWLRDAMVDDLITQMPGDNTLGVGYAEVVGYLRNINVDPIWYLDDAPIVGLTAASAPVPALGGAAAATGVDNFDSYLGFPVDATWVLYPTGTFVRLDGGNLDLGIVRTKEDVQKNKYCSFSETFEQVAYMGPEDRSTVQIGSTAVTIRGGYAPAVAAVPAGGIVIEKP